MRTKASFLTRSGGNKAQNCPPLSAATNFGVQKTLESDLTMRLPQAGGLAPKWCRTGSACSGSPAHVLAPAGGHRWTWRFPRRLVAYGRITVPSLVASIAKYRLKG